MFPKKVCFGERFIASFNTILHFFSQLQAQEDELNRVRIELNNLRQEEVKLEKELDTSKGQLNTVSESVNASEQELQQVILTKLLKIVLCSTD